MDLVCTEGDEKLAFQSSLNIPILLTTNVLTLVGMMTGKEACCRDKKDC